MYETQIGPACLRCCDFCRRFETLFVCRGADDQKPSSVQILCRHPWCPTRVEMDENMGTISAVKCKVCFLGREAAIREAPAFANPGLLRPQRRFRREGNSVSPGLTSGGEGGAPRWLVGQLADALDVPKRKSPGRGADPGRMRARPRLPGWPCSFHPTTIVHSIFGQKKKPGKTGLLY